MRVLGALFCSRVGIAPALHVANRCAEQLLGLFRTLDTQELDKTQNVLPISPLGMGAAAPGGPALEHVGDAPIEAFGTSLLRRGSMARPAVTRQRA